MRNARLRARIRPVPMIFSKDLVFVHVLKAGGVSVSQYLFKALTKTA
jgi:hypothetical protein